MNTLGRLSDEEQFGDIIVRTGADELMVTAQIFDHAARVRSYEILADVHKSMSKAA